MQDADAEIGVAPYADALDCRRVDTAAGAMNAACPRADPLDASRSIPMKANLEKRLFLATARGRSGLL
jgi:hypothetical protein